MGQPDALGGLVDREDVREGRPRKNAEGVRDERAKRCLTPFPHTFPQRRNLTPRASGRAPQRVWRPTRRAPGVLLHDTVGSLDCCLHPLHQLDCFHPGGTLRKVLLTVGEEVSGPPGFDWTPATSKSFSRRARSISTATASAGHDLRGSSTACEVIPAPSSPCSSASRVPLRRYPVIGDVQSSYPMGASPSNASAYTGVGLCSPRSISAIRPVISGRPRISLKLRAWGQVCS